jgi:hypothetical protein
MSGAAHSRPGSLPGMASGRSLPLPGRQGEAGENCHGMAGSCSDPGRPRCVEPTGGPARGCSPSRDLIGSRFYRHGGRGNPPALSRPHRPSLPDRDPCELQGKKTATWPTEALGEAALKGDPGEPPGILRFRGCPAGSLAEPISEGSRCPTLTGPSPGLTRPRPGRVPRRVLCCPALRVRPVAPGPHAGPPLALSRRWALPSSTPLP